MEEKIKDFNSRLVERFRNLVLEGVELKDFDINNDENQKLIDGAVNDFESFVFQESFFFKTANKSEEAARDELQKFTDEYGGMSIDTSDDIENAYTRIMFSLYRTELEYKEHQKALKNVLLLIDK